MKKYLQLTGLVLCSAVVLAILGGGVSARITGTNPGTDVFCIGPSAAEVCLAASGHLVPTTNDTQDLGGSSLLWRTLYAEDATLSDDLTVTGDVLKVPVSTQAVTAAATISVANACGGVVRLSATANVTTNTTDTLTAPSSSNTGCRVDIVNTGGGAITLDNNAHFVYKGSTDLVLGTNDAATVVQTGAAWVVLGTQDN